MLRFFKRRHPVSIVDTDNPLAIRDLSEHPALRTLLRDHADGPDTLSSPVWRRLAAAGPIRFDITNPTAADRATVPVAVGVAAVGDIAA